VQNDIIDNNVSDRAFYTPPPVVGQFGGSSDPIGYRGASSSRLPSVRELDDRDYDYQVEDEAGNEDEYIDEAPQPVPRSRSRNESWILKEAAPGGPSDINVIPSFGGHVALDIWNGVVKLHIY